METQFPSIDLDDLKRWSPKNFGRDKFRWHQPNRSQNARTSSGEQTWASVLTKIHS